MLMKSSTRFSGSFLVVFALEWNRSASPEEAPFLHETLKRTEE